ncbi:MAG: DnaJ domain-containing protein [Burkholderiales bacterium]|nr:DnaJ domain-containing protein [Burkholderiales bacterium]
MENINQSLYDVIGVRSDATHDEIQNACFAMGELFRPDHNPGDAYCAARFAAIERAYLVLCNPETREAHDSYLALTGALPATGAAQDQTHRSRARPGAAGLVSQLMHAS